MKKIAKKQFYIAKCIKQYYQYMVKLKGIKYMSMGTYYK